MKLYLFIFFINMAFGNEHLEYKRGACNEYSYEDMAQIVRTALQEIIKRRGREQFKELRFDLYTRLNPNVRTIHRTGDLQGLLQSNFNIEWPVRFLLHGYLADSRFCALAAIKDAYMARGNYNIFVVDLSDYLRQLNYFQLQREVEEVAEQFNNFTQFMRTSFHIPHENMYLIGHSLGCHIAGVAGKLLQRPHRYGVIIALDPAGPGRDFLDGKYFLEPSDALYVQSIQTDSTFLGYWKPNGHTTFYPNWGLGQTHCPNQTTMENDLSCDHFSALYYFAESLRNDRAFGALKCSSLKGILTQKCNCKVAVAVAASARNCSADTFLGGDPVRPRKGIYYLSTRQTAPYGNGNIVKIQKSLRPTINRIT